MKTSLRIIIATFVLALVTFLVRAEDYTYSTNNGTGTIARYIGP